ncbi:trinucleotide repeat-containing gene 6c protein [Lynx pardinus]|uniref:Trinucleotide repeat-containing gene 6c protein n=1 Tax=Lynx pardinus TaxID=191816 RepID=A0A485PSN5_LYNPA|nr:trinucleotide repeat-containing gene 6c protein [Lynx pardinus]
MEEKKKKKQEEKKKKEGAQKKAADQKTKVPEPPKTCSSQPQPAGTAASVCTSALPSGGNGKRASASSQQPAAPRYLPREVPPRFRQQEQKQLLKRGQPLPAGALASVSPTQGAGPAGVSPPPLPGAGAQQHPSKLQAGKILRGRHSFHLTTVRHFSLAARSSERRSLVPVRGVRVTA